MLIPYLGEILSVTAAGVWATAVILFKKSGETVHPIALNTFKNLLAIPLMILTLFAFGEPLLRDVAPAEYVVLLLSGILGIGLGDTLFFKSLNRLGAGLSAIVVSMYSPFVIALSIIALDEEMSLWQALGAAMTVAAVLTATVERTHHHLSRADIIWGVIWGVAATIGMAGGIVLVKPMLNAGAPILWVSVVRLFGGQIILLLFLGMHQERKIIMASLWARRGMVFTLIGSLLGGYISMLCWLGGMKYTQASTASVLNQLSTIFTFIFGALFLKEQINLQRGIGIALAIGGALLVSFG